MREIVFLKQNAEKWQQIESHLEGQDKLNPDLLADFFVQLTDDLSYAKTFYPKSNTTKYLNNLTANVHQNIYHQKKESKKRLLTFWKTEYPALMLQCRKELLTSFTIFALAALIGILSTAYDDTFVRLILGDSYVNLTLENIKNEDPMAVYKKMNEADMFLGITFNNIKVSFFAFTAGVLLSIGTGLLLFYNGIMLGAFHTFFYQKGLLLTTLKVVWIHGTLEISAIILAGAAGLVMGNSLLFPGTYKRGESFRTGARKGLKIVLGMMPVFIIAGFLEGFVTRHTEMPLWLSSIIIFGSLIFVIYYIIIYPKLLKRGEGTWKPLKK